MTPARQQPILRQVLEQAARVPDRQAVISGGRSISYGALATTVRTRAVTLARRFGVSAGDRVVLIAGANADFVGTYLAIHATGAICVPLDPAAAPQRLASIVERVEPRLTVAESAGGTRIVDRISFDELSASDTSSDLSEPAGPGLEDPADILFTTGTTAQSKGVVLSHGALAAACAHINAFIGTRPDAVEVMPLPVSHSFGLGRLRCILTLGAAVVLPGGIISAAGILRAMTEYEATGFASVPAGIAILLSDPGLAWNRLADRLDYVEIGSSAMPREHKLQLMRLLPNTRICMHYGLTEASRSAYLSFHDDSGHLDSIGRPSPGVEMRIVDDAGRECGAGTEGRIQVRGAHVMSGYWRDDELTAKTLQGGWLDTGDIGKRDADGYYYLSARAGDVINIGGRKVLPQEIETILCRHPGIAECACVGIPDPQGLSGEMISAFLVARPGTEERPRFSELATLLRQHLEPYKVPRRFTWIESLPKSSSGKILRRNLKESD